MTRRRSQVQVRRVRDGIELRVDGTLASFQGKGRAVTGVVWWALAAPVVLLPPMRRRRRVLLLGLGAGSVGRALRALDPSAEIVGVEHDAKVIRAARRHFGLDRLRIRLVIDDALAYLRRERRRFDMIVEDLFVGPSRTVRKPDWLLGEGYRLIRSRLRRHGVVVSNTIHETPAVIRAMRPLARPILSLPVQGHWNRIVVCGSTIPTPSVMRRRLREVPALVQPVKKLSIRSVPSGGATRGDRLA